MQPSAPQQRHQVVSTCAIDVQAGVVVQRQEARATAFSWAPAFHPALVPLSTCGALPGGA